MSLKGYPGLSLGTVKGQDPSVLHGLPQAVLGHTEGTGPPVSLAQGSTWLRVWGAKRDDSPSPARAGVQPAGPTVRNGGAALQGGFSEDSGVCPTLCSSATHGHTTAPCHASVPVGALCLGVQSAPAQQCCVLGCSRAGETLWQEREDEPGWTQRLLSCVG